MRLQLENWTIIDNPTAAQIEVALQTLGDGNSFAVLEQKRLKFMQTRYRPESGFILEYKDDSPAGHYHCAKTDLGLADIIKAFQSYADGRVDWKSGFQWLRYISGV
jgi:hypothetical protein